MDDESLRFFLIGIWDTKQSAGRRRQNVSETHVDHAEMGILRFAWGDKPRSTSQVGILCVKLQRSVPGVFPEGQQPIEGRLLNRSIVCVGRARPAIPDDRGRVRS